jgi:uncharacterized membrane protein YkgB
MTSNNADHASNVILSLRLPMRLMIFSHRVDTPHSWVAHICLTLANVGVGYAALRGLIFFSGALVAARRRS